MVNISGFTKKNKAQVEFEALVGPHLSHLYRMAYRFCGSRPDAEDLVQDLLVKLYPRCAELVGVDKLKPWLTTSLYRLFIDNTRRYARSPVQMAASMDEEDGDSDLPAPDANRPDCAVARDQRLDILAAAFARLSHDHRTLLALHDIEGYNLTELQNMLGLPLGTLKSRIHRARARMRELLDEGTL